jgi:hypothetical protein
MKNINFRDHIFPFILIPAITIVGVISYYRFIVNKDYIVEYEGVCDPEIQQCFVGCEDDECTEQYYYSDMHKYAPDLYAECGEDITDCETASMCLPSDRECSITYCDPMVDGVDACEDISLEDFNNNEMDI